MFDITCHICDTTYLVGSGSISSFHNTSEGPIAYVTCPEGHHLMRYFQSGATTVEPAIEAAS